ncbi:DUF5615 family PIN-like protein [Fibrella sp. WM1]|uniref:DUF5615 family PIN-like protein n=1 Tax=Fibrella musci TaxID=3242485 RepID=UPI0035207BE8
MRFLVDEQLPPLLCEVLISKGHEAIHALSLGTGHQITDTAIIQKSVEEGYTVITKDADFLASFILRNQPPKLIYVVTGNIKNKALLDLFRQILPELIQQLSQNSVVELSQAGMQVLH